MANFQNLAVPVGNVWFFHSRSRLPLVFARTFPAPPLPRQTRLVLVVFVLISGLRTNICLAERNSSLPRGWQPPTRTNGTETYHLAVSEFEWKREMKRNESAPQNWAQHPCSTQSGVPKPPRLSVNRGPETKQNEATPSGPFLSALSVCA